MKKYLKRNKFYFMICVLLFSTAGILLLYWLLSHSLAMRKEIAFLKEEYGSGGSYPAVGFIDEFHDSKGIKLTRGKEIGHEEIDITLKWENVAKRGSTQRGNEVLCVPGRREGNR